MSSPDLKDSKEIAPLRHLIEILQELPGIGEKTATRLAHFILRQPTQFAVTLSETIRETKESLYLCSECCNFSQEATCPICLNPQRNQEILCVVEEPSDLVAFERSRAFQGKYHVLHGALSPLDGIHPETLKIKELLQRLYNSKIKEVILATNPTVEGDTTALYIAEQIQYNGIKVSRIAHGIPVGAEIEYVDGATLSKALQNRVVYSV